MAEKTLIVIVGPTAVGKTAYAIKLAEELKTEIVSADSRQFYKEMEIGTAKPTTKELSRVKHHFINSLSIHDEYSVGDYERDALKCLDDLFLKYDSVIMVGGSGLFIKAVCEGLDTLPEGDKSIREFYEALLKEKGLEALQTELQEKDPVYYGAVDKQNPRRLIRALEVIKLTGKPYSEFRNKEQGIRDKARLTPYSLSLAPNKRNFNIIKIGLNIDKEELRKRINQRVDDMLAAGWIDECKKLFPYRKLNALKTVGYTELFDFIDGKKDWAVTVEAIKINTWHYAKRQLTWFKKDKEIQWEPYAPNP